MQSWLFGQAIHKIEPDAVALHTSHGYETPHSKFLMRLTVIASDLLGNQFVRASFDSHLDQPNMTVH